MTKPDASQTDELTALFNRKSFLAELSATLTQAKLSNHEVPFSVALIDIDHFFNFNDRYGHVGGDTVLQAFAQIIQELAGKDAIPSRYGGDEFAIIFPKTEREQAFLRLELIRMTASQRGLVLETGEHIQGIPVSGGVASFPIDGRSENELLRKADQALYRAKVAGRSQVRLSYEEKMVPKTSHFTQTQLERLSKLAEERSVSEADLLREAMDDLLTKYGVNSIES
jgi:diguanylate cyclase (GGDEF)-like protein